MRVSLFMADTAGDLGSQLSIYLGHFRSDIKTLTSAKNDDVSNLEFGMFMGFLNPIIVKVPNGTIVDIQIAAFDDDSIGGEDLIGTFAFYYVAGQPAKRDTRQSGSAMFTTSFN